MVPYVKKVFPISFAKLRYQSRIYRNSPTAGGFGVVDVERVERVRCVLSQHDVARAIGTEPHNVPRNFGFHQSSL